MLRGAGRSVWPVPASPHQTTPPSTDVPSLRPWFHPMVRLSYKYHLLFTKFSFLIHLTLQNCLGPGIPYSIVRLLPDTSILLLLDSNRKIHEEVSRTALPQHRYLQLPLPANKLIGAHQAHLHILLPPGYDEEDRIAFPTLLTLWVNILWILTRARCQHGKGSMGEWQPGEIVLICKVWKCSDFQFLDFTDWPFTPKQYLDKNQFCILEVTF